MTTIDIRRVTLTFKNGTIVSFLEDIALYDIPVEKTVFTEPLDSENGDSLAQEMIWRYVHEEGHPAHSAMKVDDPATITINRIDKKITVPRSDDTSGVQLVDGDVTARPPLGNFDAAHRAVQMDYTDGRPKIPGLAS